MPGVARMRKQSFMGSWGCSAERRAGMVRQSNTENMCVMCRDYSCCVKAAYGVVREISPKLCSKAAATVPMCTAVS
jgi:hypothetical protein